MKSCRQREESSEDETAAREYGLPHIVGHALVLLKRIAKPDW